MKALEDGLTSHSRTHLGDELRGLEIHKLIVQPTDVNKFSQV